MADENKAPSDKLVDALTSDVPELVDTVAKRRSFEERLRRILKPLGGEEKARDAALAAEQDAQSESAPGGKWTDRADQRALLLTNLSAANADSLNVP